MATALRSGEPTVILLGGRALREASLQAQGIRRGVPRSTAAGAGLPSVERLAYFAELATVQLGRIKHLILIDARAQRRSAYPGKQSYLVPDGCQVHQLVGDSGDVASSGSAPAPPVPERNRHWVLPIRT